MNNTQYNQVALFIAVRTVINTAIRMVYPFLRVFGRGLGIDLPRLSLALTLRSISGIAGPFLAAIADRRGRKAGMLFGLGLFTVGNALMAIWPSYWAFVAALLLSVTGNFAFIPSMQAYFGDRVPYHARGRVLGMTEFGWSLSFIIGVPLVGLGIAQFGWQIPFLFLSILGALSFVMLALFLPEEQSTSGNKNGLLRNLQIVLTSPLSLAGIIMAISIAASNELVNIIFSVWMEDAFKVQIATLAATSAVIGVSELSGEGLSSMLVDRIGKVRSVKVGILTNSIAVLILPLIGQNVMGAMIGLFLLYITFEFMIVSSIPMMTEILPQARATMMATSIAGMSLGRALGAQLAPPLYNLHLLPSTYSGMFIIAPAAVVLNIVGLIALHRLRQQG